MTNKNKPVSVWLHLAQLSGVKTVAELKVWLNTQIKL